MLRKVRGSPGGHFVVILKCFRKGKLSYLFTRISAFVVDLLFFFVCLFFVFLLKLFVQKRTRNIREAEGEAGMAPEQPGLPLLLAA